MRTAKTESSLGALDETMSIGPSLLAKPIVSVAGIEYWLNWLIYGRTCHFVGFVMRRLIYNFTFEHGLRMCSALRDENLLTSQKPFDVSYGSVVCSCKVKISMAFEYP